MSTEKWLRVTPEQRNPNYQLIEYIFSSDAFDSKPREFSSGIEGPCFVDLEKASQRNSFIWEATLGFSRIIDKEYFTPDAFCGVIRGGRMFALDLATDYSADFIARLGLKDDPERRLMVQGKPRKGAMIVIVDDVETTGANEIAAYERLKKERYRVIGSLSVMSYGLSVARENLERVGLKSHHLFSISDVIEVGTKTGRVDLETAQRVRAWQETLNSKPPSFIAKPTSA